MSTESVEPTTTPPEAPAPTPTTPETDTFASRTHESLVDEVRTLRKENEDKRKKYAPVAEVLDGLTGETREVIADFAKRIRNGDQDGVRDYIAEWADAYGITKAEVKEAIAEAEDDGPVTTKRLQEELAKIRREQIEAERQRDTSALAGRVTAHAEHLGYSEEQDEAKWASLMDRAMGIQRREGITAIASLDKAHEALERERQAAIDEYVASKGQEAQRRPAPSTSGSAPTKDTVPKNTKEADLALKRRFGVTRT